MKWNLTGTAVWFVLAAFGLIYEIWAGLDHDAHTPMLTHVVVRWVPWPFTLGFIVWLFVHFTVRYFNPAYVRWLRSGS